MRLIMLTDLLNSINLRRKSQAKLKLSYEEMCFRETEEREALQESCLEILYIIFLPEGLEMFHNSSGNVTLYRCLSKT